MSSFFILLFSFYFLFMKTAKKGEIFKKFLKNFTSIVATVTIVSGMVYAANNWNTLAPAGGILQNDVM